MIPLLLFLLPQRRDSMKAGVSNNLLHRDRSALFVLKCSCAEAAASCAREIRRNKWNHSAGGSKEEECCDSKVSLSWTRRGGDCVLMWLWFELKPVWNNLFNPSSMKLNWTSSGAARRLWIIYTQSSSSRDLLLLRRHFYLSSHKQMLFIGYVKIYREF